MWISKSKYEDFEERIRRVERTLVDWPVPTKSVDSIKEIYYNDFNVFPFLTQTKNISAYDLIWQVCYALWALIDHLGLESKITKYVKEPPIAVSFFKKKDLKGKD